MIDEPAPSGSPATPPEYRRLGGGEKIEETPLVYRYIGEGAALPNVPARDLSEADVDALTIDDAAALLASGLYVEA